jgi:hypothetical protein
VVFLTRDTGLFVRFFTYLLLFIGLSGLFPAPAHATSTLDFTSKISETSRLNLNGYIRAQGRLPENVSIAPADLNDDGLNEFVLRDKNCDPNAKSCDFSVVSETGDSITLLGEIPARRLTVGNDSLQGVHSLLAYENVANDYEYTVYVWEPQASRYMMSKDK